MALLPGQAALPAVLDVQQQAEADLKTVANERNRQGIAPRIAVRAATRRPQNRSTQGRSSTSHVQALRGCWTTCR